MREASRLPLYLGLAGGLVVTIAEIGRIPLYLCLTGGLVGGVASAVTWWALGWFFWMPYLRQLRDRGMYVDDNGWAMGIYFVPLTIAVAFVISTLIAVAVVRSTGHPKLTLVGINLMPGLWLAVRELYGVLRRKRWEYPGFEVACLLIGLGWGVALYALTPQSSYIEG